MDRFKDFTLQDGYGNTFTLSETIANSNVLLFFYRGKWWGAWAKQFLQVQEKYPIIKNEYNTVTYGISVDSPKDSKEFQEKLNLSFPLLSDEDSEVIDAYDVSDTAKKNGKIISLSANIIINTAGDVIYYHKGHYRERPSVDEMIEVLKKI